MKGNRKSYLAFAVVSLLVVALVLSGCSLGGGAPQVMISPGNYDFGQIGSAPVTTVFSVRNEGSAPLAIESISTSCGCTTAQIDTQTIGPGAAADLTVTFDPQAHAGDTGRFMRFVYLRTNDPNQPEVEVQITAEVVTNPVSAEVSQ